MIDIKGLDKASVLQALYAASKPLGMGMLHFIPGPLGQADAEGIVTRLAEMRHPWVDYLQGRVMKVNIMGDEMDPSLYDRDNGEGAAEAAISALRAG